jgi:hypothetical protein
MHTLLDEKYMMYHTRHHRRDIYREREQIRLAEQALAAQAVKRPRRVVRLVGFAQFWRWVPALRFWRHQPVGMSHV